MRASYIVSFIVALTIIISSCSSNDTSVSHHSDTPTSGTVTIYVDETFKPIMDSEIFVFEALYKDAHIKVVYAPEAECIKALLNDSAKVIITPRMLTAQEEDYLHKIKYYPATAHIATDAVALILNRNNPDSTFSVNVLKEILGGKVAKWSDVSTSNGSGPITVVFDNPQSSNVRYIQDSVLKGATLSKQVFAAKSNQEVIQYVMKTPGSIGIIGVNWCKEVNDSSTIHFSDKIRVAGLSTLRKEEGVDYPQPYQAYIALKMYPFSRRIYSINREPYSGLGTGFVSFLSSDKGQRIILKSGLVPANAPVRILKVSKNTNY
jgi:phosphate transport system substrate-binding protein